MSDSDSIITALWDALNHEDIESAIALLHPEVNWQDILNGGRQIGRASVTAYWRQVFSILRPETTVIENHRLADGRIACSVQHLVRDLKGGIRTDEPLTHIFRLKDGLIIRMDLP